MSSVSSSSSNNNKTLPAIITKKPKSRACSQCHQTKNKCIYETNTQRCERCIRLDKECVPHKSMQGKRKHNRLSVDYNDNSATGLKMVGGGMMVSDHKGGLVDLIGSVGGGGGGEYNQSRILDMVETSNLQQLSNNLGGSMNNNNMMFNNILQSRSFYGFIQERVDIYTTNVRQHITLVIISLLELILLYSKLNIRATKYNNET